MAKDIHEAAAKVAGWLRLFFLPGQVTELRALKVSRPGNRKLHTEAGFFDYEHFDEMALHALRITDNARGVYFVMNPLKPTILERRPNRVEPAPSEYLASDNDVIARQWLLVDCDPVKPDPETSATDSEKALAWTAANLVRDYMQGLGWQPPIVADSGNGYHLFYSVEMQAKDDGRVRRVLNALGVLFDTDLVKIDRKVFNPSRIAKLPGTLARKGEDTAERPHRRAKVLEIPTGSEIEKQASREVAA